MQCGWGWVLVLQGVARKWASPLFAVLPISQPDNESVKDGERDEPNRRRERYSIELINDKDAEERNHPGVGPKLVFEERRHQNDLHESVEEQVSALNDNADWLRP